MPLPAQPASARAGRRQQVMFQQLFGLGSSGGAALSSADPFLPLPRCSLCGCSCQNLSEAPLEEVVPMIS